MWVAKLVVCLLIVVVLADNDHVAAGSFAEVSHTPYIREALRNYYTSDVDAAATHVTVEERRRRYATAISVFQHVHKSGGIMVRRFLESMQPHLEVPPVTPNGRPSGPFGGRPIIAGLTGASRLRLIQQQRASSRGGSSRRPRQIVHGDHAFHYCDYLTRATPDGVACGYWIILRDPVERMVSDYNYCMKVGQTWGKQLEYWRAGRGDGLCTSTVLHFNDTQERPSLGLWVRTYGHPMLCWVLPSLGWYCK